MKILLIHNFYKVPGGEDTVFRNEKKMLEEHGHEVTVYTRDNHEMDSMNALGKVRMLIDAVYSEKTYRDIMKLVKEKDIDLIHVHNTHMLISPSVYAAARDADVPVFLTVHNFRLLCLNAIFYRDGKICEECLEDGFKCGVKHKCYRGSRLQSEAAMRIQMAARRQKLYKNVNFICLTEFNKEKLLKINRIGKKLIDPKRVFVKPNFIPALPGMVKEHKTEKNGKNFIFIGRIDETKGIDTILRAWKNVPKDIRLIVCGSGPLEEKCIEFIRENKLSNVEFKGSVEHSKALELLSEADAMLFMSKWYEGMPMTIIESFNVGTPVIGCDFGNGGEIISTVYGKKDLLLEPGEKLEESIAKAVIDFKAENYRFDASKLKRFGEEENYKELVEIYKIGMSFK